MFIARDKRLNLLFLYDRMPERRGGNIWVLPSNQKNGFSQEIDKDLFPDLRWEDEPIKVEIKEVEI